MICTFCLSEMYKSEEHFICDRCGAEQISIRDCVARDGKIGVANEIALSIKLGIFEVRQGIIRDVSMPYELPTGTKCRFCDKDCWDNRLGFIYNDISERAWQFAFACGDCSLSLEMRKKVDKLDKPYGKSSEPEDDSDLQLN